MCKNEKELRALIRKYVYCFNESMEDDLVREILWETPPSDNQFENAVYGSALRYFYDWLDNHMEEIEYANTCREAEVKVINLLSKWGIVGIIDVDIDDLINSCEDIGSVNLVEYVATYCIEKTDLVNQLLDRLGRDMMSKVDELVSDVDYDYLLCEKFCIALGRLLYGERTDM